MWNMEKQSSQGEKGFAMKRLLYIVLAAVLIAACLLSCSMLKKQSDPSSDKDDPVAQIEQETPTPTQDEQIAEIEALEDRCRSACNAVDVDGILNCLSPSAAKPMRTILDLAGSFSDTGEEQVMNLLCQTLGASSSDYRQFCETLDTELSNIEVKDDKATADLTYWYEEDGQRYEGKANLTCKRIDGQWYISKLQG